MNGRRMIMAIATAVCLVMAGGSAALAQGPAGNEVGVELTIGHWHFTDGDSIVNEPLTWNRQWLLNIMNTRDGGPPVRDPIVTMESKRPFMWLHPDDPSILTADPVAGIYTWNFGPLEVEEPAHLVMSAGERQVVAKPGYRMSRTVTPRTLVDAETVQHVAVDLVFEEPLPPEVNNIWMRIGTHPLAYGDERLVDGEVLWQSAVGGWNQSNDGVVAFWSTGPGQVQIGTPYRFEALLKATKSPSLLGAPLFIPEVVLGRSHHEELPQQTGHSITLAHHAEEASATFTVGDPVDWNPFTSSSRYEGFMNAVVSRVTPPPPPFRVIVDANVRIEPETLKLGSKGQITAFVRLPKEYDVRDVDRSSIVLGTAGAVRTVLAKDTLIAKFNRADLPQLDAPGEAELVVTGRLSDGAVVEGSDTIRVLAGR